MMGPLQRGSHHEGFLNRTPNCRGQVLKKTDVHDGHVFNLTSGLIDFQHLAGQPPDQLVPQCPSRGKMDRMGPKVSWQGEQPVFLHVLRWIMIMPQKYC